MDIDALLPPLSDAAPCGDDMSFSDEFDTLRELRRDDDPSLPQGEFVTERKVADWPAVAALCTRLLSTRSKDLRLAGWLLEAWSHLHGFAGLANGLLLIEQLCLLHWSGLHPGAADDELELRVGSLAWVLARTEALTRAVALLRSATHGASLARIDAARAQPAAESQDGASTPGSLARIQRETPRAFLVANLAEGERAQAALAGLQTTLDTLLGDDSPSFVGARRAMEAALHAARRCARDGGVGVAAPAEPSRAEAPSAAPIPAPHAAPLPGGAVQDRRQAIEQLRAVAEFFRRTEPHSPVAYLADKAARWGEMPLHAWLRVVVKDAGALAQLEDLLGSQDPPG